MLAIDQQLAVQLLSEALSLDHVAADDVRADWAARTAAFLDRLLLQAAAVKQPPAYPVYRADAVEDGEP